VVLEDSFLHRTHLKAIGQTLLFGAIATSIGLLSTVASHEGSVAAIVAFVGALFITTLALLRTKAEDRTFLIRLFVSAFVTRALVAIFLHFAATGELRYIQTMDADSYAEMGWSIAQWWRDSNFELNGLFNVPPQLYDGLPGYYYLNALVFSVLGYVPLSMTIINCLLGALTGIYIYRISKYLFGRAAAVISSMLVAFFPSLILWSAMNLKEALVSLLICLFMWHTLQLYQQFNWRSALMLLLSLLVLSPVRMLLPFLLGLVFASSLFTTKLKRKQVVIILALAALIAILLYYRGDIAYGLAYVTDFGVWVRKHNTSALGRTALPPIEESVQGVLSFLPRGLMYFFLAPLPWERVGSLTQLLTIPEMLLWYSLVPFTLYGVFHAIRAQWRKVYPLLAYVTVSILVYSVVIGNLGTMYRLRASVWVFLFVFTGVGLERFLVRVRARYGQQLRGRP